MDMILIGIVLLLVVVNVVCYSIGRKKIKNIDESSDDYKVGIKYMYISIILAVLTVFTTTIIAILNVF